MTAPESYYEYQVGGSLPVNALSYVTRRADLEFYKSLRNGEFCYVLNSRQMGKSSLRVRTMQRLQADGFVCAFIDLTGIGKEDVTAEKWYAGIVQSLVSSCHLTKAINWRSWWRERKELLSPIQCLSLFIDEILLIKVSQKIVIFVDEIDRVLSQNFSVDDFFALIRFIYNKRVDNSAYQRLTFALLGVATPSDLIADKIQTPFNIGKAIELHGFELQEAGPLAQGLNGKVDNPQTILQEILNWTGGQPFLTQKLCRLVVQSVQNGNVFTAKKVAEIVQNCIIENWEAQDEPEHLRTIRDRILRNEQKAGRLLSLYQEILQTSQSGEEVLADGSPEQTELRLSGLVVQRLGKLKVYNRIYQHIFTQKWVSKQLEKLRPYSQNFNAWVASNFQDESRLLRGQALQDALDWAKHQNLSPSDYRFLTASQDLEKCEFQHNLAVKEEESKILAKANDTLTQAQQKAKKIIGFGSVILGLSLVSAVITGLLLGKAKREQAEADILLTSVYSERVFNTSPFVALLEALKAGQKLQNLKKSFSVQKDVSTRVMSVLQQAVYGVREFNRLEGHSDRVQNVSFSPDGKILASASADNTVKLWNVKDGILLRSLEGHTSDVWSISFSPNGEILASTGNDGTVRLWNVKDYTQIKIIKGYNKSLSSVNFSPNGKTLAVGALDGRVGIFNVDDGNLIQIIDGHSEPVVSVNFSPDGTMIASSSLDGTLKLWNVSDGSLVRTLKGHHDKLTMSNFSPDGKMLATASFDHTVKLWNVSNGALIRTLEGHIAPVNSVSFSPDGKAIASASEDGTVKVWNLAQPDIEPQTFRGHNGHVRHATFSPDGKILATASPDHTVRLWRIESIEPKTLKYHQDRVLSISFSPDGKTLASASADKTIKLWNIAKSQLKTLKGHNGDVRSVSFSPDGKTLASAADDNTVKLWSVKDGSLVQTIQGHSKRLSRVSFSPDGKILALTGDDEIVKLWNISNGTLLYTLKGYDNWHTGGRLTGISFSPDGKILASTSDEPAVKLWRVEDGSLVKTLRGHSDRLTSISFSTDGQFLASGSADHTVKIWRVKDGVAVKTLKGHSNWVTDVSFSPPRVASPQGIGHTLASASFDSTIKLWNINHDTPEQTLKSHRHMVTSISFSPDGKTLASASRDGTVKLWNITLDTEDFMKLGCEWLSDYLATHHEEKEVREICQSRFKR
ncbi:MAG: AAA-like domain-containing protein [Scytonema sp. PMC 1069.18]|nr:AAA-like domain-containing protein [Scytonema sp. PMC 1069.18]MEC4883259.1 AAA-like domain-containing protein [Scytonema sp. PMC 1070.18]